ncbi:MAG: hypothetical protein H7Y15_02955, partial [Pseudonocardia sp.]|nr:hypothetical protein [Pseudonocardia sp.]
QITSFIQTTFSGGERGRAYGLFGAVSGAATAIGTVLGGEVLALLPGEIGRRWLFWINIPLGLLGLVMALRFLPRDLHSAPRRLDLAATAVLGVFIVMFLLPCSSTRPGPRPHARVRRDRRALTRLPGGLGALVRLARPRGTDFPEPVPHAQVVAGRQVKRFGPLLMTLVTSAAPAGCRKPSSWLGTAFGIAVASLVYFAWSAQEQWRTAIALSSPRASSSPPPHWCPRTSTLAEHRLSAPLLGCEIGKVSAHATPRGHGARA